MKVIDKYLHSDNGYNPYLITDRWQVAKLNYQDGLGLDQIDKMEVHRNTDEVFILLVGTAVLIASGQADGQGSFEAIMMLPGVTYNIPTGVWHNIAMAPDAQMIIVENNNTHLSDVEYTPLGDVARAVLKRQIEEAL